MINGMNLVLLRNISAPMETPVEFVNAITREVHTGVLDPLHTFMGNRNYASFELSNEEDMKGTLGDIIRGLERHLGEVFADDDPSYRYQGSIVFEDTTPIAFFSDYWARFGEVLTWSYDGKTISLFLNGNAGVRY